MGDGVVCGPERDRLAAGLGVALATARDARGWSITRLAREIGADPGYLSRLERGERRPRPVMLRHLARALTDDDLRATGRLYGRLCRAAGESLRPDTPGGVARRERRLAAARRRAATAYFRRMRAFGAMVQQALARAPGTRAWDRDTDGWSRTFDRWEGDYVRAASAGDERAAVAALDRLHDLVEQNPMRRWEAYADRRGQLAELGRRLQKERPRW